jgi:cell division GTPase FtsZ
MGDDKFTLPVLSLEEFELPEDELEDIEVEVSGSIRYAFIGIGQAGGRLCAEFYKLGYRKAICVNTSEQDLNTVDIPETQKVNIGGGIGSGAGKNMERGEEAATSNQQLIYNAMKRIFGTHVDHIILCAGSGGGTGGGALIPSIMIAKKYLQFIGADDVDKKVGVIMTLPTNGEAASPRVALNAYSLADRISAMAEAGSITPLMVIDNDRIQKLYPKLTMAEFWPTINSTVAGLFDIFNRLSVRESAYTSFDPEDYRSVINCGGHAIMGVTSVKWDHDSGDEQLATAMKTNLEKTLLADGFDLSTAKYGAAAVVGGTKDFKKIAGLPRAIEQAMDMLTQMCGQATLHRGIYEESRDGLRVYTIVGGLKRPAARYKKLATLTKEKYL